MSKEFLSLRQEARRLRIAEIRIWQLIRKGILSSVIRVGEVALHKEEWEQYLADHPEQLTEWQQAMEDTHRLPFFRHPVEKF